MTRGPGWRKCTAYRQPGPGGTPLGLGLNEGLGLTRPRANAFMECHKDAMLKPPKRAKAGPAKALTAPPPRTLLSEAASLRGRWHNELTDAGIRKSPSQLPRSPNPKAKGWTTSESFGSGGVAKKRFSGCGPT